MPGSDEILRYAQNDAIFPTWERPLSREGTNSEIRPTARAVRGMTHPYRRLPIPPISVSPFPRPFSALGCEVIAALVIPPIRVFPITAGRDRSL